MREKLYQSMIELTNGKWSSTIIQSFARSKLSKTIIPSYIKYFNITLQDVTRPINDFSTLHEFFIREVSTKSRQIHAGTNSIISPVDATVETFGPITKDGIFFVKDKPYTLENLLGSSKIAEQFVNGMYIILYLSPAEYHRIHAPVDGEVIRQYMLGKKSYPVNKWGLQYGKEAISGNYRLLTQLYMPNNKYCFHIKVGAMFVNSIELTNTSSKWKKGEEVGYFSFGSTVVLLFEEDSMEFSATLKAGKFVRMGEIVANML
ncbi:phosphatidylserine decarboxylase [Psychrobacillus sp. NEAU-3TGS]|uniref:phosphatidylserine decarboxylase n=1 Tax=Psychrobacillus sp. NEAU-3TGS TaxID=2995412 RepID=UPI00249647EC|nr:phosphatidylserine decarboxylase [Psychrobacillus sp. NEAU-3TGS]MDI2588191.1 phosphatidylserine decarboxylase [Psychrobacillus sp. NEAU-3TGS]